MLVLARKEEQSITIDGQTRVHILEIRGNVAQELLGGREMLVDVLHRVRMAERVAREELRQEAEIEVPVVWEQVPGGFEEEDAS